MAYLFKLSSRLIVERHLPTIASDAYGIRKITTTKKQIQSWPFIYKPGEHRQQSKGKKSTQIYEPNEFDRMRVKQFLSETVAMHPQYWSRVVRVSSTNPIPYASDAMVGTCMRRLDNLKR
jgi:hypothetical protein